MIKARKGPVKTSQKRNIGIPITGNLSKNGGDQIKLGPAKKRYIFNIDPNTKPRQTRSDKWKKRSCVVQYRAFADDLRQLTKEQGYSLGDTLIVDFIVPMPASWNKKKQDAMDGSPHQQTPDVDNFLKAVFDSLAKQDKSVWKVEASKRWGRSGAIVIRET